MEIKIKKHRSGVFLFRNPTNFTRPQIYLQPIIVLAVGKIISIRTTMAIIDISTIKKTHLGFIEQNR